MIMNWDLPKQTEVDDCFRCCIAAVLGVPAQAVPNFCAVAELGKNCMDALAQRWLNAQGYCLIEARKLSFPRYHADGFDGLPVIAGGPTERSRGLGQHHAVVMVASKMVYDPHPSSAGLTAVTHEYVVVPISERLKSDKERAGTGQTPNASLPPLGDGPRRKMLVEIEVTADFEKRLDNQWMVEREIQADRWSWRWA